MTIWDFLHLHPWLGLVYLAMAGSFVVGACAALAQARASSGSVVEQTKATAQELGEKASDVLAQSTEVLRND
jgi:hypothetical protein